MDKAVGDRVLLTYRAELDGLRAIAVLSVVLYHAGFAWIPGGFVGVDIFFVLSGFLITSILMREIESGEFTYAGFYERRIRRLLPPLVPVLVLSGAAAFFLFETDQFENVTKSLYSTLALSANWYFLSTVGYFDGPGEMTPLLHMWSLSIEEQFYLVFPALLVLVIRRRKDWLSAVCLSLLLVSFIIATYYIYSGQQDKAFYSSHARFWELLVGALLASFQSRINPSKLMSDLLEVGGLALMLTGVFFYTSETLFPGPAALAPVLGTAMIIAANGVGRFVSPLLRVKPIVWVGLISYGLYLWHWPVLVFVKYIYPLADTYLLAGAVIVALLLSAASYYWLEAPVRHKRVLVAQASVFSFGLVSAFLLVVIVSVGLAKPLAEVRLLANEYVKARLYSGERVAILAAIEKEKTHYMKSLNLNYHGALGGYDSSKYSGYTCSFDGGNTPAKVLACLSGQAAERNILVVGDSIGRDTLWSLRRAYPDTNFIMLHQSGCPPAEIFHESKKITCFPRLEQTLRELNEKVSVDGIVLSFGYRPLQWNSIEKSIPLMKDVTSNVVVMGVSPKFKSGISEFVRSLPESTSVPAVIGKKDKAMLVWDFDKFAKDAELLAKRYGVSFVNVSDFFCSHNTCRLWLDGSYEKPLFWDNQHMTDLGITRYAEYLFSRPEVHRLVSAAGLR